MRKLCKTFIITAFISVYLAVSAAASDTVKINDLIESITSYDGQQVTVVGEAIGEELQRGGYSWVNINNGSNAIGIWLSSGDADKISFFGNYKHIGDTVRITGTFSRDCKEHGGDVDIHCSNIEIISKGYAVKEEIGHEKVIAAAVLFSAAIFVTIICLKVKKPKQLS